MEGKAIATFCFALCDWDNSQEDPLIYQYSAPSTSSKLSLHFLLHFPSIPRDQKLVNFYSILRVCKHCYIYLCYFVEKNAQSGLFRTSFEVYLKPCCMDSSVQSRVLFAVQTMCTKLVSATASKTGSWQCVLYKQLKYYKDHKFNAKVSYIFCLDLLKLTDLKKWSTIYENWPFAEFIFGPLLWHFSPL